MLGLGRAQATGQLTLMTGLGMMRQKGTYNTQTNKGQQGVAH